MIFSSPPFFVFFAIYLLLHLAVPARHRLALVIAGSTVFYGYWNPWYLWLPYLLLAIAHAGARWLDAARGTPWQRRRTGIVVAALLLPLIVIKYTNFLLGWLGPVTHWSFPLGISFITFTMIAYVVDVHRGRYPVERRPSLLSGLVLFFPHLIAGPILRPHELLPQLAHPRPARRAFGLRFVFGLALFSVGLVKKLVFADGLAASVAQVYEGSGAALGAADYLLAWYAFCVQIYCDFSGYTDMAIGIAIVLGVRLPINFRQPFAAASIVDFWRRWHITLSTWLRDYLYVPLGGNRGGRAKQARNVMITMALGGLWHGPHWTFVAWGLWHGAGIAGVHALAASPARRALAAVPRWIKIVATFHFVCVGFVFFRAADLATAWRVLRGPFVQPANSLAAFASTHAFELLLLAVFAATHARDSHRRIRRAVQSAPPVLYWASVAALWLVAIALAQGAASKFIYFDF